MTNMPIKIQSVNEQREMEEIIKSDSGESDAHILLDEAVLCLLDMWNQQLTKHISCTQYFGRCQVTW